MSRIYITFFILFSVMACSTTGIDYQVYTIHPEVDKLEGKTAAEDISLSKTCTPDPECSLSAPPVTAKCGKCIGLLTEEYFKMKKELLELRQQMKDCQNPPPRFGEH